MALDPKDVRALNVMERNIKAMGERQKRLERTNAALETRVRALEADLEAIKAARRGGRPRKVAEAEAA